MAIQNWTKKEYISPPHRKSADPSQGRPNPPPTHPHPPPSTLPSSARNLPPPSPCSPTPYRLLRPTNLCVLGGPVHVLTAPIALILWRPPGPGRKRGKYRVFACCTKSCSKTPRYVAAVYARSPSPRRVGWRCSKDGSPKPWRGWGWAKGIQKRV